MCRALLTLHVVGLDTQDAPLAEARCNISAAGLSDRIKLRKQGIEDLKVEDVFDYVFSYNRSCPKL
jgi:23S rRNA G2445 N2-methylase RlmL